MKELFINGRRIAEDTECFLIAEIGHNHQGNLEQCKAFFDAAKEAGATAVKLQKRDNKTLFTKKFFNEVYHSPNAYGSTYGLHREALEFNIQELKELKEHAREKEIIFFATAFDIPSADVLASLDMPVFKIASGDIKNHPLIEHIAKFQKPIILSTGGALEEEVKEAVEIIMHYHSQLAVLQCTAAYPPSVQELNLSIIKRYSQLFPNIITGYSSHDLGTSMPIAAFALGARVIEKHFTLNKNLPGNDHKISLMPEEFKFLAEELKKLHKAMGNGIKCIYESEHCAIKKMGKKLVISKNLPYGHLLNKQDLAIKSPGDGIPPSLLPTLIGKRLKKTMMEEEDLTMEYLE